MHQSEVAMTLLSNGRAIERFPFSKRNFSFFITIKYIDYGIWISDKF